MDECIGLSSNGSLNSRNTQVVAKGYSQKYGGDHEETFAPMAKMMSIIFFISVATTLNWTLNKIDVKIVFLNDILTE